LGLLPIILKRVLGKASGKERGTDVMFYCGLLILNCSLSNNIFWFIVAMSWLLTAENTGNLGDVIASD